MVRASRCERDGARIFFGDREVQDEYTVTHGPHPSEARGRLKNEPRDSRCAYARARAFDLRIRNFFFYNRELFKDFCLCASDCIVYSVMMKNKLS